MAPEHVGVVRLMFRVLNERGAERGALGYFVDTFLHPDVQYKEDPSWPEADVYRGRDAVQARLASYMEVMTFDRFELDELVDGGERVAAVFQMSGSGGESGAPTEQAWVWVLELRDERVYRWSAHLDRDEGLRQLASSE